MWGKWAGDVWGILGGGEGSWRGGEVGVVDVMFCYFFCAHAHLRTIVFLTTAKCVPC